MIYPRRSRKLGFSSHEMDEARAMRVSRMLEPSQQADSSLLTGIYCLDLSPLCFSS